MFQDHSSSASRRQVLQWLGACALPWLTPRTAHAADLPLSTTGVEHFGMTLPDPEATAKFYGRIFDPQLFQERDPPLRFYVKLGSGYLGFGGNPNVAASVDHFCVLVRDLRPPELRKSLEAAGVPLTAGALGMATDPDGIRLQMAGTPGGLAKTIIPAFRVSEDEAVFQAIAPDHVTLRVSNLDRSVEHYRKLFGPEASRTSKPARVWFGAARTKIGLEPVAAGEKPAVHHICVRVAGFDRKIAADKLQRLSVTVVPSDEDRVIRFRDPNGLLMELKADAPA